MQSGVRRRSSRELETPPTDPFLILLSKEIMHYKAFNAKTLSYNIHFLLKKKLFRANCIALAHLLSIILSSYFPALLLLLSVSLSWNVISPLISSFLCLLIDMMRQKGPWRFGEDTPWGQRRWQCLTLAKKGSKLGFWCIFIVSSEAPDLFRPFPLWHEHPNSTLPAENWLE